MLYVGFWNPEIEGKGPLLTVSGSRRTLTSVDPGPWSERARRRGDFLAAGNPRNLIHAINERSMNRFDVDHRVSETGYMIALL